MSDAYKAKQKGYKYLIQVTHSSHEGFPYRLNAEKLVGNGFGLCCSLPSAADVLLDINRMITQWTGFDGSLNRNGDKPTLSNTCFESEFKEINKALILREGVGLEAFIT